MWCSRSAQTARCACVESLCSLERCAGGPTLRISPKEVVVNYKCKRMFVRWKNEMLLTRTRNLILRNWDRCVREDTCRRLVPPLEGLVRD